ncbi:MAG: type II toxin-antitoxin system VapC family toxin [Candidatus Dormibacteraceae bacterium]
MTDVICDASVVLKWFHDEGEQEVEEARRLLASHRKGMLTTWVLDLTFYELGNILLRALRWPAAEVAAQLDDVRAICAVLVPNATELRLAAQLAEAHALTFYDAAYAAAARSRGAALATADRALLGAGGGEPPGVIAARAGAPP